MVTACSQPGQVCPDSFREKIDRLRIIKPIHLLRGTSLCIGEIMVYGFEKDVHVWTWCGASKNVNFYKWNFFLSLLLNNLKNINNLKLQPVPPPPQIKVIKKTITILKKNSKMFNVHSTLNHFFCWKKYHKRLHNLSKLM